MSNFDPTKHQDDSFQALPAGIYVVAMTKFERKTGKDSGKDYLRATYRVVHGKHKGKTFFASIGIDVSKEGVANRLGLYCRAVGHKKAFDLNNDRAIADALLGKPFKAEISVTQNGSYTNNDVKKYLFEMTSDEADAAEEFYQAFCEKADRSAYQDGARRQDDDWSADDYEERTQSSGRRGRRSEDDEEIPF